MIYLPFCTFFLIFFKRLTKFAIYLNIGVIRTFVIYGVSILKLRAGIKESVNCKGKRVNVGKAPQVFISIMRTGTNVGHSLRSLLHPIVYL